MIKSLSSISSTFKELFYHLFLSLISVEFYRDIIKGFKGYGLQYTLNLSLFSALLCCVHVLSFNSQLMSFLKNSEGGNIGKFRDLDYVISQLPEMEYDGTSISITGNEPIKIDGPHGKPVILVDPEQKLKSADKQNIPLILHKDNFIIKAVNSDVNSQEQFELEYIFLFGKEPGTITPEVFKMRLLDISSNLPTSLIYLYFPVLILIIFVNSILSKVFIIFMIFLLANMIVKRLRFDVCFRLVLYASGIVTLLQPVAYIALPLIGHYLWVVQLWTNLLMISAVIKER